MRKFGYTALDSLGVNRLTGLIDRAHPPAKEGGPPCRLADAAVSLRSDLAFGAAVSFREGGNFVCLEMAFTCCAESRFGGVVVLGRAPRFPPTPPVGSGDAPNLSEGLNSSPLPDPLLQYGSRARPPLPTGWADRRSTRGRNKRVCLF